MNPAKILIINNSIRILGSTIESIRILSRSNLRCRRMLAETTRNPDANLFPFPSPPLRFSQKETISKRKQSEQETQHVRIRTSEDRSR